VPFALSPAVFAQSNTGAITGTVFDQSQAVMNDVKITATNLGTNVAQTATTNTDGVYSIPALVPGAYRLTLEKAGFKKLIREPITVESSGTVALDFSLTVGNTASQIVVNADAPLVRCPISTSRLPAR
jgi:Carboxypeptidase regulatory-like domain